MTQRRPQITVVLCFPWAQVGKVFLETSYVKLLFWFGAKFLNPFKFQNWGIAQKLSMLYKLKAPAPGHIVLVTVSNEQERKVKKKKLVLTSDHRTR